MSSFLFTDAHTHKAYSDTENVLFIRNFPLGRLGKSSLPPSLISGSFHPAYIQPGKTLTLNNTLPFWSHKSVLAVGESGLDKLCGTPFSLQTEFFEYSCYIAQTYDLPLILHTVKAYPETLKILSNYKVRFMFHKYTGSPAITHKALDMNALFSFGFEIASKSHHERVLSIPSHRLLLETDADRRHVTGVYQMISKIKGISFDDLGNQIFHNFKSFFNIHEPLANANRTPHR